MFLPRVMFMNITISRIEIIHNGGQKVISIRIHHNPDSIIKQLIQRQNISMFKK